MAVYRASSGGNTSGLSVIDDGTNWDLMIAGGARMSIRKADGQILSLAGFSSDQTL